MAKTTKTTDRHVCQEVAALVYTKNVLVTEIAGVKVVQTKPQVATQRVGEVLEFLLTHRADAEKTA